jgi:hypothetical protein
MKIIIHRISATGESLLMALQPMVHPVVNAAITSA